MREKCPSVARVQELLTIDPAEGVLRWKVSHGRAHAGQKAGSRKNVGRSLASPYWYIQVTIDGYRYSAHNLAWVLYYGECPSKLVDHVDNNPLTNRKVNLRLATNSQNNQNSKIRSDNKFGIKGLTRHKTACGKSGGITAQVGLNRKEFSKTFCLSKWSEQEAIEMATAWRRQKTLELHGDFGNHGEQSVVIDREAGTWAVS